MPQYISHWHSIISMVRGVLLIASINNSTSIQCRESQSIIVLNMDWNLEKYYQPLK